MWTATHTFVTTLLLIAATSQAPVLTTAPSDTRERWRVLAGRTIYFAHQSVGDDIISGIEELNARYDIGIRIVQTKSPAAVANPAFVHFHAGKNGDAESKDREVLRVLEARPTSDHAIVILKYCYSDIDYRTDVPRVYEAYSRTLTTLGARHPDVTVVQSTVPLTTVETPLRAAVKRLLGRPTRRDDAIARQQFNTLVRAGTRERSNLFDVAAVESRTADGRKVFFDWNGRQIDVLAQGKARDNGHLNGPGRLAVATEFLSALALAAGTE